MFKIVKHIGVLEDYECGWKKELNIVEWNDGAPMYDIRDWDETHEKMSRGITLNGKQMGKLMECMFRTAQDKI